jgi:hypothetical protein
MNANSKGITLLAAALVCQLAGAEPAPVLAKEVDSTGRPIPFGRAPHQPNDTPLGSGPYKAIMATAESLPAHVLYYPANVAAAGKLPVIAWGNGACVNAGNRFRYFLTEIASHGHLVIANGVLAAIDLEVGPQENPRVRRAGDPPPPPRDPNVPPPAPRTPGTTTPEQLIESLDWAVKENSREGSPFYNRIDVANMAVAGQSCGGVQALKVAADPRIKTVGIFNSGTLGIESITGSDPKALLRNVRSPALYLYGDEPYEIAFPFAQEDFKTLTTPVFNAWKTDLTHIGTYGMPNGGELGRVASAWFNWQLKGDQQAAAVFKGTACTLCTDPTWHVQKKQID